MGTIPPGKKLRKALMILMLCAASLALGYLIEIGTDALALHYGRDNTPASELAYMLALVAFAAALLSAQDSDRARAQRHDTASETSVVRNETPAGDRPPTGGEKSALDQAQRAQQKA